LRMVCMTVEQSDKRYLTESVDVHNVHNYISVFCTSCMPIVILPLDLPFFFIIQCL
jgi:hypothetical protein